MRLSAFLGYLAGTTAIVALVTAALMWLVPVARMHVFFAGSVAVLFSLLCAALFAAGKRAATSANKQAFIQLVMASVFGKMIAALAPLFVYREVAKPQDAWYVGLFLLQYVVYTAFEVWFMTRLART